MKKLDLFECARVDPGYPIEDQMKTLVTLQKEGKFDHIGLSECSAATVTRANTVSSRHYHIFRVMFKNFLVVRFQVAPVALVEIEVSPLSYEKETKAGAFSSLKSDWRGGNICISVIATCGELGIAVVAYS